MLDPAFPLNIKMSYPATPSSSSTKEEYRRIAKEPDHNSFVFSELETRQWAWFASGRETVWD
jgi:hypothetical protein